MEKFEFKGHPENADAAYWEAEKVKWLNGSNGLTGRHYFYLTMGFLRQTNGKAIRPVYREIDNYLFKEYEDCIKKGLDLLVVHRKEFGASSMFGANESIYNAVIHNGSCSLITSSNNASLTAMYEDKIRFFFDRLPNAVSATHKRTNFISGIKYLGLGHGGFIYGLSTKKSDRLNSFRAKYIFIDNIFQKKNLSEVLKDSQICVGTGFSRTGTIVMCGSCDADDPKGIELTELQIMDADASNIKVVFIGGNLGYIGENSDPDKAKQWILDKREKMKDSDSLKGFIKRYPLTLEEIFTA